MSDNAENPTTPAPATPPAATPAAQPPVVTQQAAPATPPAQPKPQPESPQTGNAPVQSGNEDPKWLPKRLEDAKKAAINQLLEQFGLKDVSEIEALRNSAAEAAKLKMSEQERIEAERKELSDKADKAQKEATKIADKARETAEKLAAAEARSRENFIDNKIEVAALKANAEHPEDVVEHIRKTLATDRAAILDDNGEIKQDALTALINKAKEARPTWFSKGGGPQVPGSPSNAGGRVVAPKAREKASVTNQRIIRG